MGINQEYRELLDKMTKDAEESSIYDLDYPSGLSDGIEMALKIYDELHKPVVIPQFVAEWIEEHQAIPYSMIYHLSRLRFDETHKNVYKWVTEYSTRTTIFLKAITDGYEVEQEPMYTVQVPHVEGTYFHISEEEIGTKTMINMEAEDNPYCCFTKEQIKELLPDVPEKYWEEIK